MLNRQSGLHGHEHFIHHFFAGFDAGDFKQGGFKRIVHFEWFEYNLTRPQKFNRNLFTMKTSVLFVAFVLCFSAARAQITYVSLTSTNNVSANWPLNTNQAVILCNGSSSVIGYTPMGKVTLNSNPNTFYSGLTNVALTAPGVGSFAYASIEIITPITTAIVSNCIPADAVVIPSSASGNVQIILESSTDLVNWTAALPGLYGPSAATNRFFRVRAAIQ